MSPGREAQGGFSGRTHESGTDTHKGTFVMPLLRNVSSISSILSDLPGSPEEDGKNSFSD